MTQRAIANIIKIHMPVTHRMATGIARDAINLTRCYFGAETERKAAKRIESVHITEYYDCWRFDIKYMDAEEESWVDGKLPKEAVEQEDPDTIHFL